MRERSGGVISHLWSLQFTAFDGVIIAASMSPCAAKRSLLMLWT
jgi:hypothetical protein